LNAEIIEKIKEHCGEFLCEAIGSKEHKKTVSFSHVIEPPITNVNVPGAGDLKDFYSLVGSLTLFFCKESDEAAFYIADPDQWEDMEEGFSDWVDMLDEDEEEEALPEWFGSHKVIGEIPASGNYILVVTEGEESGSIYEFEHDGFEFIKIGDSLAGFIDKALDPDESTFTQIASHMRFIAGSTNQQWWARELHHNNGKVIRNDT